MIRLLTIYCVRCARTYKVAAGDNSPDWCPLCFYKHWSDRP